MKLEDFKLSQELIGHSLDVRSVAVGTAGNSNFILSGSRDKTAKVWSAEPVTGQFFDSLTLQDHKNFISCVYFCETENWICTASNDSTICCYRLGETFPFVRLEGHKSTVCAVTKGLVAKSLISGSWDQTARIWTNVDAMLPDSKVLQGHEAAVWAVAAVQHDKYVTGSADKNIFVWNQKGEKVIVLKGHTDCVRGLLVVQNLLLSCSNDASIRVWSCETWELVKEFHGHSNYIYTMAANKALGDDVFLTGSEDSTIRMWSVSAGPLGVMEVPAQSVWSITALPNSDIVTGTSDALVRIFSRSPDREADATVKGAFDLAVQTRKVEASKKLGGVDVKDLPGPESLLQPGREGATKIVRQPDGKILCYQWVNDQWHCLGDVTGASGGTDNTSGKKLFNGKEYDFVFSVDIQDGVPPLKLPYNLTEDPYVVAQKFIDTNQLPQAYLDQIANFIVTNSGAGAAPPAIASGNYADPFTGSGRYIPGATSNTSVTTGNSDPFTGDSSYTTQQANAPSAFQTNTPALDPFTGSNSYTTFTKASTGLHFPHRNYTTVDNFDAVKVLDKLSDFNTKADDPVSKETLEGIVKLTESYNATNLAALKSLLNTWPKEILFPVLDITRLLVKDEKICTEMAENADAFLEILLSNTKFSQSVANQIMAIRCFNNQLVHAFGKKFVLTNLGHILPIITGHIQKGGANLQSAVATFYLNLSVALFEFANDDNVIGNNQAIAEAILYYLTWASDAESTYRALQGLGNLLSMPNNEIVLVQVKSVESVVTILGQLAGNHEKSEKLSECAREVYNTVQK